MTVSDHNAAVDIDLSFGELPLTGGASDEDCIDKSSGGSRVGDDYESDEILQTKMKMIQAVRIRE